MSERAARAESLVQAQRKILERLEHEEESLARRARAVEAAAQALDELAPGARAPDRGRAEEPPGRGRLRARRARRRASAAGGREAARRRAPRLTGPRGTCKPDGEEELDRHAAELARQAPALAGRASSATVRREAAQADGGEVGSRFTIDQLATLMERRAAEFPDRIEEWQYYLVSLRNVAASDGRLPESVECLVEDVFGPLLDAA